jgi:hypothetical protein
VRVSVRISNVCKRAYSHAPAYQQNATQRTAKIARVSTRMALTASSSLGPGTVNQAECVNERAPPTPAGNQPTCPFAWYVHSHDFDYEVLTKYLTWSFMKDQECPACGQGMYFRTECDHCVY